MNNAINWFEIPVADLDRAQSFYETVLARKLSRGGIGDGVVAVFPSGEAATGGCLQSGTRGGGAPADSGVRIYLDCMPSIDAALARVDAAGGRIVVPRSALPPGMGYYAVLRDTEGNEVGMHALA
jgi:predicted enzyme related to lactoylglutathione lyase